MSKPDKERYSWKQFEDDCETLAVWARGKKFKSIFGIPRGGLVLAVKLSHLLDIPLVLNREDITGHTLIVDDIADSGGTLERLKAPSAVIARSPRYIREKTLGLRPIFLYA